MTSHDKSELPENEGNLPPDDVSPGSAPPSQSPPSEPSRRDIARRIALEALRTDRAVLETSAATAFRDFSCANPA